MRRLHDDPPGLAAADGRRRPRRLAPVSYTHLGRRGQDGPPDQLRLSALCADGGQLLHHQPESGREQPECHGAKRVSYT